MNFIKKYFVFIFVIIILFLSYVPNLYEASATDLLPQDRTMVWGEHIYTYDYNAYLSKIRQGQEGRLTVVDKYDNHPEQKGVFLQSLYLISGRLTKMLNLSPELTYQLLRMIIAVFWIMTIVILNIYFLKKISLVNLGVTLSLLASSFPFFYRFQDQWWIGHFMGWWQEMDIIKRINFIPHDTLNYIFISIFTILLGQVEKDKKKFLVLCFLLFISVFIHPTASILFIISFSIYYFIKTLWLKKFDKAGILGILKQLAIIVIVVLIPLLYIKSATNSYPWKSLLDFDQYNRLSLNIKEYILALGPIFFTGVAGGLLVILHKKQSLLGLVTWIAGVAIAITLFKFFPYQSELRFVQTANHIPLAILSVYLINFLFIKFKNVIIRYSIYIVIGLIILLGLAQGYFSLKAQTQFINQRALATLPIVPYPPQVMYPINDFYNGLKWLETNTDHQAIVLSKITAGNYIPAYSGNFVYLGHGAETPFFNDRIKIADQFFTGNLTEKEAFKFIKTEKIHYVFYGPQEKENSLKNINIYNFLTPVYQTPLVIIFKVKS